MSNSTSLNKEKIIETLRIVKLPASGQDVIAAGLISGVSVQGGRVGFLLAGAGADEPLRRACEQAVLTIPGVEHVTAVLTAHQHAPSADQAPPARKAAVWNRQPLAHVGKVVAVASGKGGVGKSSVALLLAHALVARGLRTGLLDADIYGPSIPTMLGLSQLAQSEQGQLVPEQAYGILAMSMGLITGEQAAVMRAPMVTKALQQMLRLSRWGSAKAPLDYLLVDMPPGTGDVHLSLAQGAPIDGAVIVTLASKVALLDARKSIDMFEKVGIPVLGIVENMSFLPDGSQPFGSGGGEELATSSGYPLLAKLPLDAAVGQCINAGHNPFAAGHAPSVLLTSITALAETLVKQLAAETVHTAS